MLKLRISNPAHYRPILLGVAALSSFISATWAAANPDWLWWGGHEDFHIPVVLLLYATFFTIFIVKAVIEWRFDTHIPFGIECACIGFAWCAQFVAVVLEQVAKPWGYLSDWGVIALSSWVSLIALTAYAALPPHSKLWHILLFILLPERLRKPNPPDTSSQEPLLPGYPTLPAKNPEVIPEESLLDPEELVQSDSNSHKAMRKDGYTLLPGDDLEQGGP